MLALQLDFATPRGGLVALAALLPLAAIAVTSRRHARGRAQLGLQPPRPDHTVLGLVLVSVLLGLAAAQPVLRRNVADHVRTDAEALFVFDVSASMAAARSPHAPLRLDQAQQAAIRLRN